MSKARIIILCLYFFLCLSALYVGMGPVGTMDGDFNSDSAIPVIMINSPELTPYHLYYFGQDRLGGWPFVLQWIINFVTQGNFTAIFIFIFNCFCIVAGSLACSRLFPGAPAGNILFISACLWSPTVRQYLHEINNPYSIQLAISLIYWYVLSKTKLLKRSIPFHFSVLIFIGTLAVWTSNAAAIALCIFHFFEAIPYMTMRARKSYKLAYWLIPFLCYGLERSINKFYNFYVEHHYSEFMEKYAFRVKTPVKLQFNDVFENFGTAIKIIYESHPFFLYYFIIFIIFLFVSGFRRGFRGLLEDTPRRILALFMIVLATSFASSLTSWIRIHNHLVRYAVNQIFFMDFSLLIMLSCCINILISKKWNAPAILSSRIIHFASWIFLFSCIGLTSAQSRFEHYHSLVDISQQMITAPKKTGVIGNYWETYKWEGIAPRQLIVLPHKSMDSIRIPWREKDFHTVDSIIRCDHSGSDNIVAGSNVFEATTRKISAPSCTYQLFERVRAR
ncbi:MAG: hypothetical protein H6618_02705 [Deltaproteobacteria bacterium]|nr:hypothetical protein [Deltaproteobacteria bacterium]